VISNQRPNSAVEYAHTKDSKKATINFDDEGICDACRYGPSRSTRPSTGKHARTSWRRLRQVPQQTGYDCLVPGSGGKDASTLRTCMKTRFGMHRSRDLGAARVHRVGMAQLPAWLHAGFDNELTTPNGRVHRLVTRLAVENRVPPFQPFIFGQKSLAPKMAILHDLPSSSMAERAESATRSANTSSARARLVVAQSRQLERTPPPR